MVTVCEGGGRWAKGGKGSNRMERPQSDAFFLFASFHPAALTQQLRRGFSDSACSTVLTGKGRFFEGEFSRKKRHFLSPACKIFHMNTLAFRYQSPFAFDTPPISQHCQYKKSLRNISTQSLYPYFFSLSTLFGILPFFLEEPKSKQVRTLRTPNRDWGKRGGRRGEGRKGKANPEGQKRRDGAYHRG